MRIAALVLCSIAVGLMGFAVWQEFWGTNSPAIDDGWRRTAAGWERVELWATPPADEFQRQFHFHESQPQKSPSRWDVHPGIFAVGQLAIVLSALLLRSVCGRQVGGSH